jgi:hypothetical protein
MKRGPRLLGGLLRLGGGTLLAVVVVAAAPWGTLALWFALPVPAGVRLALAMLFAGLGIGGLIMMLRRRRIFLPLLPFTGALLALLVWWSTIEPSNERAWQPDVARLPSAEIEAISSRCATSAASSTAAPPITPSTGTTGPSTGGSLG